MKIGFVRLYEVDAEQQAAHGQYVGMFRRLLSLGGVDAQWHTYDARNDDMPQDANECDGYVFSGSKHAVYESHPWMSPLLDCIRMLHDAKKPMLGVCFGHQVIAAALGGEVENCKRGWGIGRQGWDICGERPWMQPMLTKLHLLASHQDQVVKLPACADLLAQSDFCPLAMYAVESHIFCMQGHPEFMPEYVYMILQEREGVIPESVRQVAIENHAQENDQKICAQWIANFFIQAIQANQANSKR